MNSQSDRSIVREHMRSPDLEHYFSVKMNCAGAVVDHAAGAVHSPSARLLDPCVGELPVMGVKQAILQLSTAK